MDTKEFNELIGRMKMGDASALETFYLEYGKKIYSVAYLYSHNHHTADDAVNEILIKVWNLAPNLGYIKNPASWINTVTKHYVATLNKSKNTTELEINEDIACDNSLNYSDAKLQFFDMIRDLNENEQKIMIYKFIHKMNFAEIGDVIHKSVGYVSVTYYRAIEKLRKKNV